MTPYKPGDDLGPLEDWPFFNPASDYVIRRGNPRASGRIDTGGPGQVTRSGIWRCTEQGDELMTILGGRCRITHHVDGTVSDLAPGDSLFIRDGSRVTWDITEDLVKVFFAYKSDGY